MDASSTDLLRTHARKPETLQPKERLEKIRFYREHYIQPRTRRVTLLMRTRFEIWLTHGNSGIVAAYT
jgi:hypothetical protein